MEFLWKKQQQESRWTTNCGIFPRFSAGPWRYLCEGFFIFFTHLPWQYCQAFAYVHLIHTNTITTTTTTTTIGILLFSRSLTPITVIHNKQTKDLAKLDLTHWVAHCATVLCCLCAVMFCRQTASWITVDVCNGTRQYTTTGIHAFPSCYFWSSWGAAWWLHCSISVVVNVQQQLAFTSSSDVWWIQHEHDAGYENGHHIHIGMTSRVSSSLFALLKDCICRHVLHYYNRFMAPWTLSRTTLLTRY